MATKTVEYRAAGTNVEAAIDGEFVLLRFPLDRAKSFGQSTSGKTDMIAKTDGGWANVPGAEGLRFNLQAGYKVVATKG